MDSILKARGRYSALRRKLDPDCPVDRELLAELSAAIRALDRKLAASGWRQHTRPAREGGASARA